VKVLTAELHEVSHNCVSVVALAIFAGFRAQLIDDGSFFLRREEVGDLTTVQEVIDVFKEGFFHDLGVRKQEDLGLALNTRFH